MAVKIPLNKFRSKFSSISAADVLPGDGWTELYRSPERRATIIILSQITNLTPTDRTITVAVSTPGLLEGEQGTINHIVKNFAIPPYDARGISDGRLVIQGPDNDQILVPEILIAKDTTNTAELIPNYYSTQWEAAASGLEISLGLLETINTD
jgi:hypothetical protein